MAPQRKWGVPTARGSQLKWAEDTCMGGCVHPMENKLSSRGPSDSGQISHACHVWLCARAPQVPSALILATTLGGQGLWPLLPVDRRGNRFRNILSDPGPQVLNHCDTIVCPLWSQWIRAGCGPWPELSPLERTAWPTPCALDSCTEAENTGATKDPHGQALQGQQGGDRQLHGLNAETLGSHDGGRALESPSWREKAGKKKSPIQGG